jgi:hypothetical protein
METREIPNKKENKLDLTAATYFVVENLPEITALKKIAEDKTEETLIIGDNKWNLRIFEDEGLVSSGEKGNVKEIILTKEMDKETQFGIIVEENFDLVLGSIINDNTFRFNQPVSLIEITRELRGDNVRRIKESFAETHNQSKTAVALNLRPDYVAQIVSQPIPQTVVE